MATTDEMVTQSAVPALGQSMRQYLRREAAEIGQHTVAFLAAIFSIWVVHLALGYLLGHDAKFYDRIPVRYVTDTGHLAVLIRFVWQLVLQIGKRQ